MSKRFRQPIAVSDISIYICLIDVRSKSKEQLNESTSEANPKNNSKKVMMLKVVLKNGMILKLLSLKKRMILKRFIKKDNFFEKVVLKKRILEMVVLKKGNGVQGCPQKEEDY